MNWRLDPVIATYRIRRWRGKSTEGEAETSGGGGAKPSRGEDTTSKRPEASIEKTGSVPNVSGEAESGKIPKNKVGAGEKTTISVVFKSGVTGLRWGGVDREF